MELAEVELELDVQTLFDAHFHLDRSVGVGLGPNVRYDKVFFFRYAVVVAVNHHVDVIPKLHHDSIIALELLLHSVELEIVLNVVRQRAWWLEVAHDLKKSAILVLVVLIFNDADQLYAYAEVVDSFVFIKGNSDLALDVFSILKKSDNDKRYVDLP